MTQETPSPQRARTLALQNRSFEFTCAIIGGYPKRSTLDDPSRDLWRQLVRAAGSSTFNLEEADAASSDADFLAKMRISLREIKEARVVMRVIVRCKLAQYESVEKHLDEAGQLVAIFMTIVKNKDANIRARLRS
jgi:four helix bundle protein